MSELFVNVPSSSLLCVQHPKFGNLIVAGKLKSLPLCSCKVWIAKVLEGFFLSVILLSALRFLILLIEFRDSFTAYFLLLSYLQHVTFILLFGWISKDMKDLSSKPYIQLSLNTALQWFYVYEVEYGILFTHFKLSIGFLPFLAQIGNPVLYISIQLSS